MNKNILCRDVSFNPITGSHFEELADDFTRQKLVEVLEIRTAI